MEVRGTDHSVPQAISQGISQWSWSVQWGEGHIGPDEEPLPGEVSVWYHPVFH